MMNREAGFTLIELMIVVAIIGILASIAMPAYQNYTRRAHVAEALVIAAEAKSSITEYYASNGILPTSNVSAGIKAPSDYSTTSVKTLTVGQSGIISINFQKAVEEDKKLNLSPEFVGGQAKWVCTIPNADGVTPAYVPSVCR